jgi:hypothetical protein
MPFDLRKTTNEQADKKLQDFFSEDRFKDAKEAEQEQQSDFMESESERNIGEIFHSWEAPEFEAYEKSRNWYIAAGLFIFIMVAYAIFTNGPIMAVTFILIGIVGFIYSQKDPRTVTFSITSKGVLADKQFYLYENIFSFWIFYEPTHTKVISLHTKASVLPFVHIPIENEDPVKLRELLMQNIPEIKQDQSLINTIERVLHI